MTTTPYQTTLCQYVDPSIPEDLAIFDIHYPLCPEWTTVLPQKYAHDFSGENPEGFFVDDYTQDFSMEYTPYEPQGIINYVFDTLTPQNGSVTSVINNYVQGETIHTNTHTVSETVTVVEVPVGGGNPLDPGVMPPVAPVPLPAGGLMLAAGVALLGLFFKRVTGRSHG